MRLAPVIITLVLVFSLTPAAAVPDAQWSLAWEDCFDRSEVGGGWHVCSGRASIHDGRLLLEGGGATALTARAFKPDVRIEFDVEAMPGPPPCDLSATIGANPDHGMGYLLAFGGQNNRVNQILGPGVRQVVEKPPFAIEHGKTYHIVAQQEGRRLTLTVNGVKILDAVSTELAAGPGFDREGLVTWNGMYVDNFRVYERVTPHPDTPVYQTKLPRTPLSRDGRRLILIIDEHLPGASEAVSAFNDGKLDEALRRFRALGDNIIGLVGQAYVMGDPAYREKQQFHAGNKTEDFEKLAEQFGRAVAANPSDEFLAAYARAAESFSRLVMAREGLTDAIRLVALGPENNPFYHKARFYEARYHYWNGAEGGSAEIRQQACDWMAELKKTWPENTVLRQYTGEQVPWGDELTADTQRDPAWAAFLREAYARQIRIMDRFFTERQSPDGQLGGGYGDDCELMRTWMQIAAISSASERARAGIQCLADGIWDNELESGFAGDIGDVEHSSEPSADTLPTMLLIRYGDPTYVERNMRSCKTIRDRFMGIDRKGYPRFRSSEYGAAGVNMGPAAGGDTGYNARTMKHFIWQAWWGDPEAGDWFVRWCDGWRAAAMAETDGKLAGFMPGSIWYPSGEITPPGSRAWWDEKLNYYGCPGMGGMIVDCFLCAYHFTRDPKFLKPFLLGMDMATRGPLVYGQDPPPSREWQQGCMFDFADPQKTATYKWLTGERVYDEYTRRFGDPAQVYGTDYDLDAYMKSFEEAARGQRCNLELQTTEVLSTDRAALTGALTVFGAYTGAVCGLRDAATPTFAVTYDTPDTDFAALVTESTPARLRVWLYSFNDKPVNIGLKLWQLVPGKYVLNQGEMMAGEHSFQHRYGWVEPKTAKVLHRADTVRVDVPPRKTWVVDLRLDAPISVPKTAPDLALSSRDLKRTAEGVEVTVHNIGSAGSPPSTVVLQVRRGARWETAAEAPVPAIPAPGGFDPSRKTVLVAAKWSSGAEELRVVLDPGDKVYELCEDNNSAAAAR